MGGVTNFLSVVDVRTLGTADIDRQTAALEKLSASIGNVGKQATAVNDHPGFSSFAEKIKAGIENPLGGVKSAAMAALEAIGPLGAGVATAGGIFAAVSLSIFEAAKSLGEYGTQIRDVQLRTGLAAKEVGQYGFAAKVVGQDISLVERMMRGLTMAIEDQSEKGIAARQWLGRFHIDMAAVKDGSASTSMVLQQIAGGLEKLPSQWERNKAALDIFKKSGIEAIPMMLELNKNLKEAKELGFGASQETVDRFVEYQKQVVILESYWSKIVRSIKDAAVNMPRGFAGGFGAGAIADAEEERRPKTSERSLSAEREARELMAADADLDRRVKRHVELLNEARKIGFELDAKVQEFGKKMTAVNADPISKINLEMADLLDAGGNRNQVMSFARLGILAETEKQKAEFDAKLEKAQAEAMHSMGAFFDQQWKGVYEGASRAAEDGAKEVIEWLKKVKEVADAIEGIRSDTERSEASGRSDLAVNLANLRSGPGQEGATATFVYQERIRLANELYGIEMEHAHTRIDEVKAEAALRKGIFAAQVEHELKIAELQQKRLNDLRNTGQQLFDAALGGKSGIEQFAKNFILGQGRTLAGNAFAEIFKNVSPNFGLSGKLFQGTILGQDPLKGATDMNTLATADNSAKLALLTAQLAGSASGGGGGTVAGLRGFGRFLPGGDGYNTGSGEGPEYSGDPSNNFGIPGGTVEGPNQGSGEGMASFRRSPAQYGTAAVGTGLGIYGAITSPSTKGKLASGGGALMSAGSAVPPPVGPAMMIAGAAMQFASMILGDPKVQRGKEIDAEIEAARYTAPMATTYTMDRYGHGFDMDTRGGLRIEVNIPMQNIDTQDFKARLPQVIDMVSEAIENRMSPRLDANIRRTAFPR